MAPNTRATRSGVSPVLVSTSRCGSAQGSRQAARGGSTALIASSCRNLWSELRFGHELAIFTYEPAIFAVRREKT